MTDRSLIRVLMVTAGFLVICLMIAGVVKAQTEQPMKVLILHSYHQGFVWTDAIQDGIEAAFEDSGLEFELYTEYMDTKRFPHEQNYEHLENLYKLKYAQQSLDVIVSSDDNALQFLLREGQDLFPGVPVVFCGVDHFAEDLVAPHRHWVTGVVEGIDIKASLDLGLRLRPSTKHVVVTADTSAIGEANKAAVRELAPQYQHRVDFTYLSNLTLAELQERLRDVPEDAMVLYLHFSLDRTGTYYSLRDSITAISQASPAPVYGSWDFSVKYGVTGGYVTNGFTQGNTAAKMALRILSGASPSDVEIVRKSPNTYMFNYEQMERFDIKESDLPKDSIVINKTFSFYEQYKTLIWIVTLVILSLLFLVVFLVGNIIMRRRAEGEILRLQHLLQNITDSMPSVLITLDLNGRVLTWNPAAEEMTGRTTDQVQGQSLWQTCPEMTRYQDLFERVISEGQVAHRHKEPLATEAGAVYRDVSVFPLVADDIEGAVLRIDDVTRRVQLEEMMLQSAKMASVGGLAAGVAHEINNPLGAIMQSAQVLQMAFDVNRPRTRERLQECGVDPKGLERYLQERGLVAYLEGIRATGARAAKIVADLLSFSRKTSSDVVPHDLNALVEQTLDLAATDYDLRKKYDFRDIEIVRELTPDLPKVVCDGQQIQQVVLNLVRNAAHAMVGEIEKRDRDRDRDRAYRPRLTLRTSLVPSPSPRASRPSLVRLEVEDNGPGIPEGLRARLFEPFFTTKDVGKGTGLGLWLCWSIVVKRHSGRVWAEPGTEGGSRFVVELPIIQEEVNQ